MERRSSQRLPSDVSARLCFGNLFYTGLVTDLSENGVFIRTKMSFPVNSMFVLLVYTNEQIIKIAGKVKRTVKPDENSNPTSGMGIELVNPPENYFQFVNQYQEIACQEN